jgi:hypothetical protein
MNVNKWKRKERKGIERKEKENHKKKISKLKKALKYKKL